MKKIIKISVIFSFISISFLPGCLKDVTSPVPVNNQSDNARLLYYLEQSGDYINTVNTPSLVNADEVYANIDNYLLVDIRSDAEYSSGHIDQAVNKPHSDLIAFLNDINYKQFTKVIIISTNGQSSSFYTCLLRLYGFDNVYSLNYGMASWNFDFANEWFTALQQFDDILLTFNLELVPKPDYSPLPDIHLSGSDLSDAVKQRISDVLQTEFEDTFTGSAGSATIDFTYLGEHLNDYFIICYNTGALYRNLILGISHPDGAVLYTPPPSSPDLSSTTNLQTLPSDKEIVIYSTDGQLSAFAVAYLQVLGYNARSILFGANNMFYTILAGAEGLNGETFSHDKIYNYPYVTGN